MLNDIVDVQVLDGYRLRLEFEDGTAGELDLGQFLTFDGVFAPLRDREEFAKVVVDKESGTICWPGGADLDPAVLYARVTGHPIDEAVRPDTASMVREDDSC